MKAMQVGCIMSVCEIGMSVCKIGMQKCLCVRAMQVGCKMSVCESIAGGMQNVCVKACKRQGVLYECLNAWVNR